jgi:archaellum component FlaG (FlaF/FlaG flagellin family)
MLDTIDTVDMTATIRIQNVRPGRRYVAVTHARFVPNWTVATVERHRSQLQVLRDGRWVSPVLVTVTYRNGEQVTHEHGTVLAIDLNEPGDSAGPVWKPGA